MLPMMIGTVFSQEPGKVKLLANAGFSFPFQLAGEFYEAKFWKTGYNWGVGMGYTLSSNLSCVGYFDYSNFAFNDIEFKDVDFDGGSAQLISISGNLRGALFPTPSFVSPYLIAGIGYLNFSLKDITVTTSWERGSSRVEYSESAFLILLGTGFDVRISQRLDLFLEGKYNTGYTSITNVKYFQLKTGFNFYL